MYIKKQGSAPSKIKGSPAYDFYEKKHYDFLVAQELTHEKH